MKYYVSHLYTVEVDAEDSVTAEAQMKTVTPNTGLLQSKGKVIRVNWNIEEKDDLPEKIDRVAAGVRELSERLDVLEKK